MDWVIMKYKILWGIVLVISCVCQAQDDEYWSRNRRVEVFAELQNLSGDTATGTQSGNSILVDMDSTPMIGLGLGYNLTRRINLNMEVLNGSTDWQVNALSQSVAADADYWLVNANLEYHPFRGRFTPVVGFGFGIAKFKGKLSQGSSPTPPAPIKESEFSSNYIIGIRFDARNKIAYKLLYQSIKTDFGSDSIRLGGFKAVACYMFK